MASLYRKCRGSVLLAGDEPIPNRRYDIVLNLFRDSGIANEIPIPIPIDPLPTRWNFIPPINLSLSFFLPDVVFDLLLVRLVNYRLYVHTYVSAMCRLLEINYCTPSAVYRSIPGYRCATHKWIIHPSVLSSKRSYRLPLFPRPSYSRRSIKSMPRN